MVFNTLISLFKHVSLYFIIRKKRIIALINEEADLTVSILKPVADIPMINAGINNRKSIKYSNHNFFMLFNDLINAQGNISAGTIPNVTEGSMHK